MKIIVRPILDPQREIDLTHRLVAAIAEELWRLFGGNDALNWIEAEWHLQRIIAQARSEALETAVVRAAPPEAPHVPSDRAVSRPVRSIRRERSDTRSARSPRTSDRRSREAHGVEGTGHWKADTPQMANTAMANA